MPAPLPVRELYCPAHFGNTWEVAGPYEMREHLTEARHWGINRYSDWFDAQDLYDPYNPANNPRNFMNLPEVLWARKFSHFTTAAELGLELGLCITPNHVFTDQLPLARPAVLGDEVFGQLLCPSHPAARGIILRNQENLFRDFAGRGLDLRSISLAPYDYGGCLCEECAPYLVTFGKLCQEIGDLGRSFFPDLDVNLVGWWWKEEEHRLFAEWADREAPGYFRSLAYHLPYGTTAYDRSQKPLPAGCAARAFAHVSYAEQAGWVDIYGHLGPVLAPERLEQTVEFLRSDGAEGFMAYNEGAHADVNVALLAGLASGRFATATEVLAAYAERHFGGEGAAWAQLLTALGKPYEVDLPWARRELDRLAAAAPPSWRLEQIDGKLRMLEANARVLAEPEWNVVKLAAAEDYWRAKEWLMRRVYGLGLLRTIFVFDRFCLPPWQAEYLQVKGRAVSSEAPKAGEEA